MRLPDLRRFTRWRYYALRISASLPCLILSSFIGTNVSAIGQESPARSNTNPQKAPIASGQISGHVYRADNSAPLAKSGVALIPVSGSNFNVVGQKRFTVTDAEGAYAFTQVGPGNYLVAVQRTGFIQRLFDDVFSPEDADQIKISSGETISAIDIRLIRSGVISGTILDEENQPLENVTVEPVHIRFFPGGRHMELSRRPVKTDDQGNFRIYDLPPGNYFVRTEIVKEDFQIAGPTFRLAYYPGAATLEDAQRIKVSAGSEMSGIRFSVGTQRLYSITGKVIDHDGPRAPVRFSITAGRYGGGDDAPVAITGADGSFTIHGVPSGEYFLMATAIQTDADIENGASEQSNSGLAIVRVLESDARANIQITSGGVVGGKAVVENGTVQSASGVTIALWPQNPLFGTGPNWLHDEINKNGVFKITKVLSGSYDFGTFDTAGMYLKKVICHGKEYTLLPLTIEAGVSVNDCLVTLGTDAGVIKGQVLDGEKPVRGMTVIAVPEQRSLRHLDRFTVVGRTNSKGEYQISGVIPGDYLLFAVPSDDSESYFDINFADRNQRDSERVSVKSGDTKIVTLKPTTPQ